MSRMLELSMMTYSYFRLQRGSSMILYRRCQRLHLYLFPHTTHTPILPPQISQPPSHPNRLTASPSS